MDEEKSSQDRIDRLIERINFLEYVLRDQSARLYSIEQYLRLAPRPAAPETAPEAAEPRPAQNIKSEEAAVEPSREAEASQAEASEAEASRAETSEAAAPLAEQARQVPQFPPPAFTRAEQLPQTQSPRTQKAQAAPRGDLESRIGGNWFNWIGIIAISFGVAFFLKYAFENEWIGPRGRVGTGVILGIGFLAAAERLRSRGYARYAYGLSGGGVLILYLSVYAAFAFYALIGQFPAFLFMALVTTTAALLAARYDALPIAFLGLIGGFLTPILLSTGVDNEAGLFSYIALLDAGVLSLAYSKRWRSLNYAAFIATVLMILAWMIEWYAAEKLAATIFFLTLFFAIFALLAVLYNIVNRRRTTWADLSLIFLNALFYFGASYDLLEEKYEPFLGLFAVLMSAFYLGLGYFTYSRDREDRLLVFTFLGLAFLFLVLAVPIQLDQQWVTMGWAIEGAVMTWIGLRAADRASIYAALLVFLIAALHWAVVDAPGFAYQAGVAFTPLLNRRAYSCAVLIASLAAAALFHRRFGSKIDAADRSMFAGVFTLGANVLALTLLSLDANDYFEQASEQSPATMSARFENAKQLTLSALWSLYGCAALVIGITRRILLLRIAALVLLALALTKTLTVDLSYYDAAWHRIFFNQTFAAFGLLIAALACGVWFYSRAENIDESEKSIIVPVIIVIANLLAVIALSAEASGHFERQIAAIDDAPGSVQDMRLAQQLSLSVIWMVYGGAMLAAGIARGNRLLRVMALLLLGITIIKVFFIDLAALERLYRIISFIVLGAILLAVSFLYQKYRQRSAEVKDAADARPHAG